MKKEKMNNKGFSLVELIIVVAIMAVLVVALAPQYLKYVEKSRNSTDVNNATAMVTAIQVYAADPDAAVPFKASQTFSLKVTSTGTTLVDTTDGSVAAAFADAAIAADAKCKSKTTWSDYTIKGEVKAGGSIEFEYESTSADGSTDAFAKAMK